jgi:hypothetical protein
MKPLTTLAVATVFAGLALGSLAQTATPTGSPTSADSTVILPTNPTPTATTAPQAATTASKPKSTSASKSHAKKPAKTAAKSKSAQPAATTHFAGTLIATNRLAMTLTVEDAKGSHVYCVTSSTRITKGGKPAIYADAVLGEEVTGTAHKSAAGTLEAVSVHLGAKAPARKKPAKTPH